MKKILTLALVLIMTLSMFTSCDPVLDKAEELTYEQVMAKAEEAMKDIAYTAEMTFDYSTEDETLQQNFKGMDMSNKVTVNKNSFKADLVVVNVGINMVCVDNVLYYSAPSANVKYKASVTEEQFKTAMESYTDTDTGVEYTDFADVEMKKEKGKYVITAENISTEAMNALLKETGMNQLGASIDKVSLSITVSDDKIEEMTIKMEMTVKNAQGADTAVTCDIKCAYAYGDNVEEIKAPSDADSYTEIPFDQLWG